jgi:hypothetical protein
MLQHKKRPSSFPRLIREAIGWSFASNFTTAYHSLKDEKKYRKMIERDVNERLLR